MARASKKRVTGETNKVFELKGRTEGQERYLEVLKANDVVIATGPAGTGKSYMCLALAAQYLQEGRVDYVVIARPTIEAIGKNAGKRRRGGLGFLPGDQDQKISPYLYPAVEHLKKFLGPETYTRMKADDIIRFEPLEYMRGRTYNNTFMILEEAQNAETDQLVMFVSRMGENTRVVLNGDVNQSDLDDREYDDDLLDLEYFKNKIQRANLEGFGIVELDKRDIVRNKRLAGFLGLFE